MFTSLLVHRITVSRLSAGTGIVQSYSAVQQNLPCMIQPMTAEFATKIDMVFGKSFYCYTAIDANLKEGDKVVDQDGREYQVSGSMKRNYGRNMNMTYYLSEQAGDGSLA